VTENDELEMKAKFRAQKVVRVWSDWCSTGIWDERGVCVPVEWLPDELSMYATSLIDAMQIFYDRRGSFDVEPYDAESTQMYSILQALACNQLRKELPDWQVK
jgi:hypothetical protein